MHQSSLYQKTISGILCRASLLLMAALLAACNLEKATPEQHEVPGFLAQPGDVNPPSNSVNPPSNPVNPPSNPVNPPSNPVNPPSNPGNTASLPYKPVGFVNHGTVAALVMPWTYVPQDPSMAAAAPETSTISFPPNVPGLWPNSSRFLSLPLGTYTWCYQWELGDINSDSIVEHAHTIDVRPVTLKATDSDFPEMGVSVDISIPPSTDILPGDCKQVNGSQTQPEFSWANYIASGVTFYVRMKMDVGTLINGETYTVIYGQGLWTVTGKNRQTGGVLSRVYPRSPGQRIGDPLKGELNLWGAIMSFDNNGTVYSNNNVAGELRRGP
jgi:hypothetical protein